MPSPSRRTSVTRVLVTTSTPSSASAAATSATASGSERAAICSPACTSVTWLPKRANACANSRPDRTGADHEQRGRQLGELEHADVVDPRDGVKTLGRREECAGARRDQDVPPGQHPVPDAHRLGIDEGRFAGHRLVARIDEALPPGLLGADEPVLACFQPGEVEGDRPGVDAEVAGSAEVSQQLGGSDVLLGRLAGVVRALPAPEVALDEGNGCPVVEGGSRGGFARGRAGADDDEVEPSSAVTREQSRQGGVTLQGWRVAEPQPPSILDHAPVGVEHQ